MAQLITVLTFYLLVLSGTAYIVFWKGHSGWWFAFALLIMSGVSIVRKCECGDDE